MSTTGSSKTYQHPSIPQVHDADGYRKRRSKGPGYTTLIKNKRGLQNDTGAGLRRPLDVMVTPDGQALYIVDMGAYEVLSTKVPMPKPYPGTGVVWRILPPGVESSGPPAGLSILHAR